MLRIFKNIFSPLKAYSFTFFRWLFLGALTGLISGAVGALFSKAISAAASLRGENLWLIFLLPLGGVLTVAIYKVCRIGNIGTNQVLKGVTTAKKIPPLLAPAIFAATFITHLCGGSAGKEGAALQLGGSISSLLSKIFRLNEGDRHILTTCGMAAFFAAVFGTPIGACVFALEVVRVGSLSLAAIFPVFLSGITAKLTAMSLGAETEHFHLADIPDPTFAVIAKIFVIAAAGAVISLIFCHALHYAEKAAKKYIKNDYIRIIAGGVLIIILSLILGLGKYNGSGIEVIHGIFSGSLPAPEAFILKMLLTVVTVAAGFKGGEIIPTLFIGAALGTAIAPLVGLSAPISAAVAMAALFCGVTNCPLASVFLTVEMFGDGGMIFFAIAAAISFLLSGNSGLYTEQKMNASKLEDDTEDEDKAALAASSNSEK